MSEQKKAISKNPLYEAAPDMLKRLKVNKARIEKLAEDLKGCEDIAKNLRGIAKKNGEIIEKASKNPLYEAAPAILQELKDNMGAFEDLAEKLEKRGHEYDAKKLKDQAECNRKIIEKAEGKKQ